jgi:hypothetical protein
MRRLRQQLTDYGCVWTVILRLSADYPGRYSPDIGGVPRFFCSEGSSKAARSLALRSTSSARPAALTALNSYEQYIDLDESNEPSRFRFPT